MSIESQKLLPSDYDNERGLLSCVMQDPSLIRSMTLTASLFSFDASKKLFAVVSEMEEEQQEITIPSLWDRIKNSGIFRDLLDFENLFYASTTTQNAGYYHKKLLGISVAREIILTIGSIQDKARQGEDPEALIASIAALLDKTAIGSDETPEIVTAASLKDPVIERYDSPVKRGLSTGWYSMDPFYTVVPGELTVITGVPSHGKSSWLSHLLINMCEYHDWRVGMYSPENQPLDYFVSRLLPLYVRKPFHEGMSPRMNRHERDEGIAWLDSHFVFLDPINPNVDRILGLALRAKKKGGLDALVIDPWNEVQHPQTHSETTYISEMLTKIRRFGRRYGIHIFIVAHPMKLVKAKDGTYPIPTPYDISGAAHWRNKADNCITVWRDLDPASTATHTSVHIQKIRFDDAGKLGMVELGFDGTTRRFIER